MTNKELRDRLSKYPDDMEVVIFTSEDVDDGDGWTHTEYYANEITNVDLGDSEPNNWIKQKRQQVISLSI